MRRLALLLALVATLLARDVQAVSDDPTNPGAITDDMTANDPVSFISIHSRADVDARRATLIGYVWSGSGLPTRLPDRVDAGVASPDLADLDDVASSDRIGVDITTQGATFTSTLYRLRAARPNGRLMVMHSGHGQTFAEYRVQAQFFLTRGYSVLLAAMPGWPLNTGPLVDFGPPLGKIRLNYHPQYWWLESPTFNPERLFLEPVPVALNALAVQYTEIDIVGLSGGGWTVTMLAAIDTRIQHSFPVAGVLPEWVAGTEYGDREQSDPGLVKLLSYEDIYLLGALPSGRSQIQVLNYNDPCCFSGSRYLLYAPTVSAAAASLGGSWSLYSDTSAPLHQISSAVLNLIDARLRGGG